MNNLRYSVLLLLLPTLLSCKAPPPADAMTVAQRGVYDGRFSKDGHFTVVSSLLHGTSLWRNTDKERLYNWSHAQDGKPSSAILSVDIDSANGRALTTDTLDMVIWDVNTGQALRFWQAPAGIIQARLLTGAGHILLGLKSHSLVLFDAVRGGVLRQFFHEEAINSIDASADRRFVISGSDDDTAIIWSIESGKPIMTIQHSTDVQHVALSARGRFALTAAQYDQMALWDIKTRKQLSSITLNARGMQISAVKFNQDETHLLLGYPGSTVELRKLPSLKKIKQWQLPRKSRWKPSAAVVIDVAFDKKTKQYRALTSDGVVYLLK